MFKSWSVGKPQILVQVSVEKKNPKKTTTLFIEKKNDQPVLHIYKWKTLYMFI